MIWASISNSGIINRWYIDRKFSFNFLTISERLLRWWLRTKSSRVRFIYLYSWTQHASSSNLNKNSLLQSFNVTTIDRRTSIMSAWKYTLFSGKSRCKYLFYLNLLCTVQKDWSKITRIWRCNYEKPAFRNQTIYNKSYSIKQLRKKKSRSSHIRYYKLHESYAMLLILKIHVEKKN